MRTRFAPSPTGFLHVGALRTALFAWLVAKQTKDAFTLRIEDTDQAREVAGATENIIRTLKLAGIPPDEGVTLDDAGALIEKGDVGPYHQSKRLPLYRKYADELLANGHAYVCFCTSERLDAMRKKQQELRQAPMYDRQCVDMPKDEVEKRIAAGEKHVIRLKIPRDQTVVYDDAIYGTLSFKGHTIDDQVLLKSDGFPTYHLAHVVDDHLMKTDMVIRGEEWLSSLPKHLILFKAFGWDTPKYAHVPLLLNKDRTKLSKRQNDVAAEDYLNKGYLPEALLNFLALLGWNPGTEQELFSVPELISAFSLERVQKSGAVFDLEKLDWLQGQWMRKIPVEEFAARIRPMVEEKYPDAKTDIHFVKRAGLIQQRITFFPEAPEMMAYLYESPKPTMALVANPKQKLTPELIPTIVKLLKEILAEIPEENWKYEVIRDKLEVSHMHDYGKVLATAAHEHLETGVHPEVPKFEPSPLTKGQKLWTLRAMLTGREYSPGAYEVADLLGKSETMKRLAVAPA